MLVGPLPGRLRLVRVADRSEEVVLEPEVGGKPPVVDRFVAQICREGRAVVVGVQPPPQLDGAILDGLQQFVLWNGHWVCSSGSEAIP
jgi:hypothetical protein